MPTAKIWNGSAWVPVGSGPTVVQNAGRIGDVVWWPFATLPTDAVECNGQVITAAAWPELHALLVASGNPFGTSGGNPLVINLKGKFLAGQDTAQIEFDTLLETAGVKSVTLTSAQSGLPAHSHPNVLDVPNWNVARNDAERATAGYYTGVAYPKTNTGNNVAANAAQAHDNLPPYTVGRWIMRARTTFQGLGSQFATEAYVQQQVAAQVMQEIAYATRTTDVSIATGTWGASLSITVPATTVPVEIEYDPPYGVYNTSNNNTYIHHRLNVAGSNYREKRTWCAAVSTAYPLPALRCVIPASASPRTVTHEFYTSAGTAVLQHSGIRTTLRATTAPGRTVG